MKQRLFVVIVALAIFTTAVWLLQTAAKNARPQLRPSLRQHQHRQDDVDLGDFKLNQNMIHGISFSLFTSNANNSSKPKPGYAMTHAAIFDTFNSLDVDDIVCVTIKLIDRSYYQLWIINEVNVEPEGIYVQYFPFKKAEVQLAFVPKVSNSHFAITAVKRLN